jgi:hypothetical protein
MEKFVHRGRPETGNRGEGHVPFAGTTQCHFAYSVWQLYNNYLVWIKIGLSAVQVRYVFLLDTLGVSPSLSDRDCSLTLQSGRFDFVCACRQWPLNPGMSD